MAAKVYNKLILMFRLPDFFNFEISGFCDFMILLPEIFKNIKSETP